MRLSPVLLLLIGCRMKFIHCSGVFQKRPSFPSFFLKNSFSKSFFLIPPCCDPCRTDINIHLINGHAIINFYLKYFSCRKKIMIQQLNIIGYFWWNLHLLTSKEIFFSFLCFYIFLRHMSSMNHIWYL
jgi:hypothetical protein